MIDLSVVIPVYNGAVLLERCLESVVAQKTNYALEVWLVDDGSTDKTVALYQEKYLDVSRRSKAGKDIQFRLLQQKNAGPSKARNWGMMQSQGRYVALLDADDYWEDGYVEQTVSFLDRHADCVAVSVVCKNISVSGESYTPAVMEITDGVEIEKSDFFCKKNEDLHNKNRKPPFIIDDFYSYWAKYCHVGTCSTTMRTDKARLVLMREDLRISEDYEFWWMLANHGKWGMIPDPLYVSDGTVVIEKQQDWLDKMQKRWNNAPSLKDWERRIVCQNPSLKEKESFRMAEGRVARNLAYCQLLSGRTEMARQETLLYGNYFVKDTIGVLMNCCKYSTLTWWILCKVLRYREYHRFKK